MEYAILFLILFPIFMVTVVIHEVSHGWVALRLGDSTALRAGRLTLNPFKHIDPVGTLLLPLLILLSFGPRFVFGWAKPVPISVSNLRHPKRDILWVGIAGPLSNYLMASLTVGLIRLAGDTAPGWVLPLAEYFVVVNLVLGTFNLIPIPPLDGSRVLMSILPSRAARYLAGLEGWGWIIVVVLLYTGVIGWILDPLLTLLLRVLHFS